jgi:hypothetical protein
MLNFLSKFVKRMMGTPFIPAWIAQSPNPAGTMLACILRGREMGFKALESTEVFFKAPDGRLGLYSKPMTALMLKAGATLQHKIDTDEEHELYGKRKDGNDYTARFTRADADRAGLTRQTSSGKDSMHTKWPRRMNKWRCLSDMFNTLFPDLSGNGAPIYTAEELLAEVNDGMIERGDSSNGAFQEQAERNREKENPFHVGEAPAADTAKNTSPAKEEAKSEPVADVKSNVVEMPSKTEPAKAEEKKPAPVETKPEESRSGQTTVEPSAAVKEALAEAKQDADPNAQVKAPTPHAWKAKMAEEVRSLTELYDKLSPATLEVKFKDFMKGFLNVKALGKGSAEEYTLLMVSDEESRYRFLLRYIRALLTDYPTKLIENPHGLGTACGVAFRKFRKSMEEWVWTERCQRAAIDLMFVLQQEDTGGMDTTEYLEGIEVVNLAESDLWAFFQVALRTRDAYMLVDQWKTSKVPISKIVAVWGIQVDTAPIDGLNALLRGGKAKAQEEAPKAAPAPPEVTGKDEIDDILSLFD